MQMKVSGGWVPFWQYKGAVIGTQLSQPLGPNLHTDCKELGTQPSQRQVLTNQHRLLMGVANNFLGPNQ